MQFVLLILGFGIGFVPSLARAEGMHSFLQPLLNANASMLHYRKAKKPEFPEALYLYGHDRDGEEFEDRRLKCSAVAFGRCIVTAGHCIEQGGAMTVTDLNGFKSRLDLGRSKHQFDENRFSGNDIAVTRLENTPSSYLTLDDLVREGDLQLPNVPDRLKGKVQGLSVTGVGFGISFRREDLVAGAARGSMQKFAAGIELYHQYVKENSLEEKPEIN